MEIDCKFENYMAETHKAVYGNGDPKHGLLWKMDKVLDFIHNIERIFWPLVISAMVGSGAAVLNLLGNTFLHINK